MMHVSTTRAILFSASVGARIIEDFPYVREEFLAGSTRKEVANRFDMPKKYGCSLSIAVSALSLVRNGWQGTDETLAYDGVLTKEEGLELAAKRRIVDGKLLREKKLGMFGLSAEVRSEHSRAAGLAAHQRGIGIHDPIHKLYASMRGNQAQGNFDWNTRVNGVPAYRFLAQRVSEMPMGQERLRKGTWDSVAELVNETYCAGQKIVLPATASQIYSCYRKLFLSCK